VVEIRSARFGADPEKNDRCVDVTAALQSRVANGRLDATVDNGLAGDPAGNVVKKLVVDYVLDGKPGRLELPEGETLRLPAVVGVQWDEDVLHLDATKDGAVRVTSTKPGRFDGKTASGKALRADIASVVAPLPAGQSWRLSFPAGRGAPEKVELDGLTPWNEHTDPGVKHFSGTAVYHTTLHVTESIAAQGGSVWLDLGSVKEIAEVKLNGVALGTLWKPPFRLDISRVVKSGENDLEVRVTNLWPNRLIGDAGLPPEQRVTWSTRQPYKAGDPLLPSGLIGPVRVLRAEQVVLKPLPTSSP
jgi:hypothetical protein